MHDYDHVFITPYPFFRIRSVTLNGTPASVFEETVRYEDQPDDFDEIIKRRGQPISWQYIHKALAPDVAKLKFYRAVWLLSCIGFQERADFSLQKKILEYCEVNRIYLPEDGALPAILHPLLKDFLLNFDGAEIFGWDELREHSIELPLNALEREETTIYLPQGATSSGLWAIHVPDPGVLITSQFDGTEALIAMTDNAFKIASPEQFLEIEKVDDQTYCDWLNPKEFFKREE